MIKGTLLKHIQVWYFVNISFFTVDRGKHDNYKKLPPIRPKKNLCKILVFSVVTTIADSVKNEWKKENILFINSA